MLGFVAYATKIIFCRIEALSDIAFSEPRLINDFYLLTLTELRVLQLRKVQKVSIKLTFAGFGALKFTIRGFSVQLSALVTFQCSDIPVFVETQSENSLKI
jgi:hypothetical protein